MMAQKINPAAKAAAWLSSSPLLHSSPPIVTDLALEQILLGRVRGLLFGSLANSC
jgi:hypothetical protein